MKLSRRKFLLGSAIAGSGLVLGFSLKPEPTVPNLRPDSFRPNAWLQIMPSGEVIFQCDKVEMGQGIATGLATLIGEELDLDPEALTVEFAGIHPKFRNTDFALQLTGGSTSIKVGWYPLRHAAASARQMLLTAASQQLQLPQQAMSAAGPSSYPQERQMSKSGSKNFPMWFTPIVAVVLDLNLCSGCP